MIDGELLELRNATYAAFVDLGRAPAARELGEEADVRAGWRQLHDAHALVLDSGTDEIRMANPFSAVPTAYRVEAVAAGGTPTAPGTRSGSACARRRRSHRSSCPDCGEASRSRSAAGSRRRRRASLPLSRPGRALVGRHRLHLKHDESLPVGRAHRTMARDEDPGRDDPRPEAVRSRARLVGRHVLLRTGVPAATTRTRRSSTGSVSSDRSGDCRNAIASGR